MNLLKAAMHPLSLCTFFCDRGASILMMASIFFWVGFNSSVADNESEQLLGWHSEDTFFWIELPPVSPQAIEDQLQIFNEVF
jgi:hypothetical protein